MNILENDTMVTINDVFNIIQKSMKQNVSIKLYDDLNEIELTKDDNIISMRYCEMNNSINVYTEEGRYVIKDVSEEDFLKFKMLLIKCKKYQKQRIINIIDNFLKKDDPITIDDLDNEND